MPIILSKTNLIIAGGTGKGVLYGVYGLLEIWGFRMYTSTAIHVPTAGSINIPKNAVVVVPAVQYRTTSYADTRDPEYTDWHRLSSRDDWGLFVHTFNELVPPDQYGNTHPEYYSLIHGTSATRHAAMPVQSRSTRSADCKSKRKDGREAQRYLLVGESE